MTSPHAHGRASALVPVALMVFGNVIFAFNDVWQRRIADDIGIAQTVWARSVLFLIIMIFAMRRSDWRELRDAPKPHMQIVRGIFPVLGAFL
ncbi:MAG: hypothetical protein ACXW2A_18285, partial [Burkholderiales bacterium]